MRLKLRIPYQCLAHEVCATVDAGSVVLNIAADARAIAVLVGACHAGRAQTTQEGADQGFRQKPLSLEPSAFSHVADEALNFVYGYDPSQQ